MWGVACADEMRTTSSSGLLMFDGPSAHVLACRLVHLLFIAAVFIIASVEREALRESEGESRVCTREAGGARRQAAREGRAWVSQRC